MEKIQGYETGKAYDETVKELYYFYSGTDISSTDTDEERQAEDDLNNFLEKNIKDEDILKGIEDLKGALVLVTAAQAFADGFKAAAVLSARKSALPGLNERLLKKSEEAV